MTDWQIGKGQVRLRHLDRHGPGAFAFDFKSKLPPPGETGEPEDLASEPFCVGWS